MTPLPRIVSALGLLLCIAGFTAPARGGARVPAGFVDELLAAHLDYPVAMAFLPDGRLLVTEKNSARIRLLVNTQLSALPVATMDSVRSMCGLSPCIESGFLGIAVDPGWPARPYLYVMYDWTGGPYLRLARLTAAGDLDHTGDGSLTADPESEYVILGELRDLNPEHNGGTLRFAPDGMLVLGVGDDDERCLAQILSVPAGKLLRLDVGSLPPGPGVLADYSLITPPDNPFVANPDSLARLVWASGLRNPWNFHIDPPTGRLFVPDVGEILNEEVSLADAPGLQFGWPWYEGYTRTTTTCLDDSTGSRAPIYMYDRSAFGSFAAIMGAGVYRRPTPTAPHAFPAEYEGDYFFSDLGAGFMRRLKETDGVWSIAPPVPGQPNATDWANRLETVTDYRVGPDGALWYVKNSVAGAPGTGEVHRIHGPPIGGVSVPPAVPAPFRLDRPYPSPSRGSVTIGFTLARPAIVRLSIHDLSGRAVRTLASGERLPGGALARVWDGCDSEGRPVPAGLYVVTLATPEGVASSRCLIAR